MSYYVNDKLIRTLPEQVAQNQSDIQELAEKQSSDESAISTNAAAIATNAEEIKTLEETTAKMVDINNEQTITAQKTFTQGIKTNKVTNINGYAVVADDGSANLNVGNSSRALKLLGSAARPQYNGSDVALLTDTTGGQWDTLMDNLGIGRWANQTFLGFAWQTNTIYDDLLPYYGDCTRTFANVTFNLDTLNMASDFGNNVNINYCFYGFKGGSNCTLTLKNHIDTRAGQWGYFCTGAFANTNLKQILVADDCTFNLAGRLLQTFADSVNLTTIGAFDVSNAVEIVGLFDRCKALKSIKIKHWKLSFSISSSTAFEESDLVEIISNLDAVTSTQTLTMGATNLAKLTNAEILVATGKGWVLA